MRGLTILVTGAAGGLGAPVCEQLVARGARVIAHARTQAELDALLPRLGSDTRGEVADLESLAAVAELARRVGRVDVVVNNAGVGFGRDQLRRETSHDGIERRFAVNYVAAFLLSHALVAGARALVQVASAGQRALDFSDLNFEHGYDGITAYRRSKLAQVMLAFDLAELYPACSTALHPGTFLDTPMVRESGITPLGTAAEGADAIMDVLARTLDGVTGVFFDQHDRGSADDQAYDLGARHQLREYTRSLVRRFVPTFDLHAG